MGIRLDWEIEAEQSHIQRAGEDPETARKRRVARLRLLFYGLLVIAVFGGIAALVVLRLRSVDEQIAQVLRNTVDAEIAALRIGDEAAFLAAQRSASDDWQLRQEQVFNTYQNMKLTNDLQLTGQITDLTIDQTRARVGVQEIIDGVPYTRVWFYWRYDDGWRHVPPDFTFWGDVATYEGQGVSVRYGAVDNALATAMGAKIETWLAASCAALACGELTPISVEIVPDEALEVSWSAANPWVMQVPSPYVAAARSDMPFNLDLQFSVANLLSERLVASTTPADAQPAYPADSYYLRQAVVAWLVGRFIQVDSSAHVIDSLATNYGDESVGRLLAAVRPDANVSILAGAAGVESLDKLSVDWRDFLSWRLTLEDELIRLQDEGNFLNLYDTRDENARLLASQRFATTPTDAAKSVVSVQQEVGADGAPILRALVHVGSGDDLIQGESIFRLVDGTWKRAN